jgi:hypothetical protein
VARINWVLRVAWVGSSQSMVPLCCDLRTSRNSDNHVGYRSNEGVLDTVADEAVGSDIGDRLEVMEPISVVREYIKVAQLTPS